MTTKEKFEKWDKINMFKYKNFALRVELEGLLDLMNPDNVKFINNLTNAIYEDRKKDYTAGHKEGRKETLEEISKKIKKEKKFMRDSIHKADISVMVANHIDTELKKLV